MLSVNQTDERAAFEREMAIGQAVRDPDNQFMYQDQFINALWRGWLAGIVSYTGRRNADE